jgi:nitrate reductase gamma subunit
VNISASNLVFFVVLPYVAVFTAVVGSAYRYCKHPITISSRSSQLLENRQHFWAVVLFHYGVIASLTGHLIGFLVPQRVLAWNSVPMRLYMLEAVSIALGTTAFLGFVLAILRRSTDARARRVTSAADWVLIVILFIQLAAGISIALFYSWGAYWYHASAVPYLRSLLMLHPDPTYIAVMPWPIQLHVIGACLILLLLPFTRLVHMLVAPLPYMFSKPQVSRWHVARSLGAGAQPNGNAAQLALATGSFALCFAVFGSVAAMMPIIRKQLHLDPLQASIAVAVPVLLGSLGRIMGVYLPIFLTETFHLTPKDAGFRTAMFILVATAMRPVGGWLSDKVGGRAVLNIGFPMLVVAAVCLAMGGMTPFTIGGIGMAIAIGLGNGAVFKLVPEYFPATVGGVTGLVGAAGGLGGFFPPLVLGVLKKSTGSFMLGFVFLGIAAAVCLLVVRPKLFALCLDPPEPGSPPRACSRQRCCPHARGCAAATAA